MATATNSDDHSASQPQFNHRASNRVVLALLGCSFLLPVVGVSVPALIVNVVNSHLPAFPPLEGRYAANMRPGTGTIVVRPDDSFSQVVHYRDGHVATRTGRFFRRADTAELLFPAFIDPETSGDIFGLGPSVVPAVAAVSGAAPSTRLGFAGDEVYYRKP